MYIVLVPVLGLFFRQKPPKSAVFSVILAVIGLYLLSCLGVTQVNIGDMMLMGCALAFAVQITCIDRLAGNLDGLRLNCIQALVVSVLSAPVMFLAESPSMSNILQCWLPLGFAGVLSMGVAYSLQIIGQKHLEPTAASLLMSLESVFAVLGGWLILHETLSTAELIGCILVFAAVILSQLPDRAKKAA
jgi:drug/metabolite transporter (DMT)-like permease